MTFTQAAREVNSLKHGAGAAIRDVGNHAEVRPASDRASRSWRQRRAAQWPGCYGVPPAAEPRRARPAARQAGGCSAQRQEETVRTPAVVLRLTGTPNLLQLET